MTDKENSFAKDINVPRKEQIIIDGCNVSECVHYEDLSCTAFRDSCGYPLDCKDFFFCNYKQLARKTQECEKLKKQLIQKDKVGTNDIEKSLLYIWSECVLEIVSVKQYKEIKKLFDEKIKQTITKAKGMYNENT